MIVVEISGLLERERSVVSGQITDTSDEHFSEGWMHVKEESPVDVPAAHLAEVRLVPADPRGLIYFVEPGPEGEKKKEPKDDPFHVDLLFPSFGTALK